MNRSVIPTYCTHVISALQELRIPETFHFMTYGENWWIFILTFSSLDEGRLCQRSLNMITVLNQEEIIIKIYDLGIVLVVA